MCESLVRRVWMVALVLLFTAGVAASQVALPPFQNSIAWGGPIQPPDVGSADNHPQPGISPDLNGETPTDTPGQTPGNTGADSPAGSTANGSADNTGSSNPDNIVRQLGTPFPLQLQPQGLKIGPLYVPSISDSFFYAVNTAPGQPTNTLAGNSIMANLVYSKPISQGTLAIQAREQFSVTQLQPYFNQTIVASFTDQLTERWSFSASAFFTFFQSSLLANPQYLLYNPSNGTVQQTGFVQTTGYTLTESNNFSMSYQMNGRTQITFTPILGATFQDQPGVGWSNVHQFGGLVAVTRSLNSNLSVSGFYGLTYSETSGAASSSQGWASQNLGVSFQGTFLQFRGWSLGGGVYVSSQRYGAGQGYTFTPAGRLTLLKSFRGGASSIAAAYSRQEASNILVSTGYYDQGDISYNQRIGQKIQSNVGVGTFRTLYTGYHEHGKRAGGGINYLLSPRVSLYANYNHAYNSGTQATFYRGNTNILSFGLTWSLGSQSGL